MTSMRIAGSLGVPVYAETGSGGNGRTGRETGGSRDLFPGRATYSETLSPLRERVVPNVVRRRVRGTSLHALTRSILVSLGSTTLSCKGRGVGVCCAVGERFRRRVNGI